VADNVQPFVLSRVHATQKSLTLGPAVHNFIVQTKVQLCVVSTHDNPHALYVVLAIACLHALGLSGQLRENVVINNRPDRLQASLSLHFNTLLLHQSLFRMHVPGFVGSVALVYNLNLVVVSFL
jgi:hypothetical protein